MSKIIIGYTILIGVTLMTALIGVLKRKTILDFGEMSFEKATSIKFWFIVLTNHYIIGIFTISILMFIGTLIVFSILTADKVLIMSWTLMIPSFFITILSNYIILGEKINPLKYNYLIILLVSLIIGIIGVWGYLK